MCNGTSGLLVPIPSLPLELIAATPVSVAFPNPKEERKNIFPL